ncbi:MAG TPA: dienelactone hydrolase family protein [Solirubrobacteraceae bacterium]|jgi:carboxymethylenebutenolidase|nr:dienelactone hydrolase family protein [Solirubrobacteraceae bacterium]
MTSVPVNRTPEGAGHAFFADYRPSNRPKAAAKLWPEIVPFLSRHLHA